MEKTRRNRHRSTRRAREGRGRTVRARNISRVGSATTEGCGERSSVSWTGHMDAVSDCDRKGREEGEEQVEGAEGRGEKTILKLFHGKRS